MRSSIIGIVRFSVVSTSSNLFKAWKVKNQPTFEEWCATVFSDDRLSRRFDLFECLTLPSLESQTDKGFKVHVMTSSLLPSKYKDRLIGLSERYSFLKIHELSPDAAEHGNYSSHIWPFVETRIPFASFRLDDDDALSQDFISRLRTHLSPDKIEHAVTLCRGFTLFIDKFGCAFAAKDSVQVNPSVGMAFISGPRKPKLIFDRTALHLRMHHKVPTITDGRSIAFAYVKHAWNDTGYEQVIETIDGATAEKNLKLSGIHVKLSELSLRWKET